MRRRVVQYDLAWTMFLARALWSQGGGTRTRQTRRTQIHSPLMEAGGLAAGVSYLKDVSVLAGKSRAAAGPPNGAWRRRRGTAQEATEEAGARESADRCAGIGFDVVDGEPPNSGNAKPVAVGPKSGRPERIRLGRASALSGRVVELAWSRNTPPTRFLRRHYIAGEPTHTGNTKGPSRPRKRMWPAPLPYPQPAKPGISNSERSRLRRRRVLGAQGLANLYFGVCSVLALGSPTKRFRGLGWMILPFQMFRNLL